MFKTTKLYNNKNYSDIQFIDGTKIIYAHKNILALKYDYYEKLFNFNPDINCFQVTNLKIYEIFLSWIYCTITIDDCDIKKQHLTSIEFVELISLCESVLDNILKALICTYIYITDNLNEEIIISLIKFNLNIDMWNDLIKNNFEYFKNDENRKFLLNLPRKDRNGIAFDNGWFNKLKETENLEIRMFQGKKYLPLGKIDGFAIIPNFPNQNCQSFEKCGIKIDWSFGDDDIITRILSRTPSIYYETEYENYIYSNKSKDVSHFALINEYSHADFFNNNFAEVGGLENIYFFLGLYFVKGDHIPKFNTNSLIYFETE